MRLLHLVLGSEGGMGRCGVLGTLKGRSVDRAFGAGHAREVRKTRWRWEDVSSRAGGLVLCYHHDFIVRRHRQ